MTRWLRLRPGPQENAAAAAAALLVGVGIGAVVFYLSRILISREVVRPLVHGASSRADERGGDG